MVLLIVLLDYCPTEKEGSKKDLILPIGSYDFEIILTLLAKIIVV